MRLFTLMNFSVSRQVLAQREVFAAVVLFLFLFSFHFSRFFRCLVILGFPDKQESVQKLCYANKAIFDTLLTLHSVNI